MQSRVFNTNVLMLYVQGFDEAGPTEDEFESEADDGMFSNRSPFIVMILPKVPFSVRLCRHSEFSGNAPYGEGLGWGKQ